MRAAAKKLFLTAARVPEVISGSRTALQSAVIVGHERWGCVIHTAII
jgi:hypothetical protein